MSRIEPLNDDDRARLALLRATADKHGIPSIESGPALGDGRVLTALQTLLDSGTIRADDTYELQSLGILLGDLLADALGLTWRAVDDEYGRDPCLVLDGTSVVLFPMTMLSKRIERGEHVDVRALVYRIAKSVEDVRSAAVQPS